MKINKSKGNGKVKKYLAGGVIAGAAQAALGVGQAIYGVHQAKKAGKEMDRLLAEAPKLSLPSAYSQYAQKAMDRSALNQQTEAINRRLATSTDALSKAGGRALLGGLQSQVTQANISETQAQDAQLQREMQGLQVLGGAQAQNQQMREQRFQMQYGEANAAKQAALANIGAGLGAAAKGATVGFTSFDEGGSGNKISRSTSKKKLGTLENPDWGAALVTGEKGMKTKGEFSHDSNPITMTDKNGNVVGEVTGGEYVLNPEQAKAIKKESKYFRNLLKKKQFKS